MSIDPNIKRKADDIRNKVYGSEVRESLASGLEAMSEDVVENEGRQSNVEQRQSTVEDRQTDVENRFDDQIAGNTDVDEVIDARRPEGGESYPTLRRRLDAENQDLTRQLAQIHVNVRNYGTDIEAFRQAYEDTPAYGVLFVPQRDEPYIWNPTVGHEDREVCLNINKPITIVSDGAEIKLPDFFDNELIRRMIRIDSDDVTIRGLVFNPNTDNQYKIDNQGFKWWWAEEGDTNILVHRTDTIDIVAPSSNVIIERNVFKTGFTGVRFSGYDFFTDVFLLNDHECSTGCKVRFNKFERMRNNAVNQSGGSRFCDVHNNEFINNYYHSYRNYYGNEKNKCFDNLFYRNFDEMGKWYNDFNNRYYRTSNPNSPHFFIQRGHVRIGRGNEYSRYIRDIEIKDNTLITLYERSGTVKIYDLEPFVSANIITDFNSGGAIIKNNTIVGGKYGIMFRDYFDSSSKKTIIESNDLKNVEVGTFVNYTRTSVSTAVLVRNNSHENVPNPLHLDTVRAFVAIDLGKNHMVIAPKNSENKGSADVVLQEGQETLFIQNLFNSWLRGRVVEFLDGTIELGNFVACRREFVIRGKGRKTKWVLKNIETELTPALSIREPNSRVSEIEFINDSGKAAHGLELRECNEVYAEKNTFTGFNVNIRVRQCRNAFVRKNLLYDSAATSIEVGNVGSTCRQVFVSENILEPTANNILLGPQSNRCVVTNNVLNGKIVTNEGASNLVGSNLA